MCLATDPSGGWRGCRNGPPTPPPLLLSNAGPRVGGTRRLSFGIIAALSGLAERDPWYASWFGEEYLALYPERDDREAARQAAFARGILAPYASKGSVAFL